jgi:phage repressor protein C with HTH and peptisase S24 domain
MKKNEGKILAQWLDQNDMSVSDMADRAGVTRQTVYYHIRKEAIDVGFKDKLSRAGFDIAALGVKPFDNPGREEPVFRSSMVEEPRSELRQVNLAEKTIMYVPLVNKYAYAGYLSGFGDAEYIGSLPAIPMIADREGRGNYVAFEVKGDSMDDGTRNSYEQGDIIICRQIAPHHWQSKLHIHKYDFVVVHRTDGVLLKKIVAHDTAAGTLTLHSLNPLYDDFTVALDDVAQLFNVIKVEREK